MDVRREMPMHPTVDALRVAHDPASYYRPWAQRIDALPARQRSALNRWLVSRYALPPSSSIARGQQPLSMRLISGWRRLPATAWLMACAKQRSRLMGSRLLFSQPPLVHAFLRLRFDETELPPCSSPLVADTLLAWGAEHLRTGLRGHIPDWLGDRMNLCFAGLPRPLHPAPSGPDKFDMTCFWSAWNHAADLPGTAAGFCR